MIAIQIERKKILLEWEYEQACLMDTNINQHLPTLRSLGEQCTIIMELGVCNGWSTRAFLASRPKELISVEKARIKPEVRNLRYTLLPFMTWRVLEMGSLQLNPIDLDCDLILFDTVHRYGHLKKELDLLAEKSRKFLVFHDTVTFGVKGEGHGPGILQAINEYVAVNTHWSPVLDSKENNGLMVFQRS